MSDEDRNYPPFDVFQKPKGSQDIYDVERDVYCLNCGIASYERNGWQCGCGMPLIKVQNPQKAFESFREFILLLSISDDDRVEGNSNYYSGIQEIIGGLEILQLKSKDLGNVISDKELEEYKNEIDNLVESIKQDL